MPGTVGPHLVANLDTETGLADREENGLKAASKSHQNALISATNFKNFLGREPPPQTPPPMGLAKGRHASKDQGKSRTQQSSEVSEGRKALWKCL